MFASVWEEPAGNTQQAPPSTIELSQRRVGIAGCGVITPAISSSKDLLPLLPGHEDKRSKVHERTLPLEHLHSASQLGPRVTKKLDRFSLLGVAAARAALNDAGLEPDEVARCGVVTGNMMAGWTFTEPQLRSLYTGGVDSISPYLATAWFPAAPQGQITINLKMRGFAKTVTTDRCSGAQAIGLAYKAISGGREDLLLAGGVEAPVTPLVESGLAQLGQSTINVVEGAAYLLLSAEADAGTAIGFHSTFSFFHDSPLTTAIERVKTLVHSLPKRWPVKTVICNVPACTVTEMEAGRLFKQVFHDEQFRLIYSTRIAGECLAASGAIAVVMAHEILKNETSPSSAIVFSAGHQCGDLLWVYRS